MDVYLRSVSMSRVQLALNVTDLEEAITFDTALFGTEPAKVQPGYANFAIADPPLKLVLFGGSSDGVSINHLGVEVDSSADVIAAVARLGGEGLETTVEEKTTCCYAVQDKVWVSGPDAEKWEVYTVLADASDLEPDTGLDTAGCCSTSVIAPVTTQCC